MLWVDAVGKLKSFQPVQASKNCNNKTSVFSKVRINNLQIRQMRYFWNPILYFRGHKNQSSWWFLPGENDVHTILKTQLSFWTWWSEDRSLAELAVNNRRKFCCQKWLRAKIEHLCKYRESARNLYLELDSKILH